MFYALFVLFYEYPSFECCEVDVGGFYFGSYYFFHGSIVDFMGLAQKQPISRARDTVKKEGPWFAVDLISL